MEEGRATYKRPVSSGLFYYVFTAKTAHFQSDMNVILSLIHERAIFHNYKRIEIKYNWYKTLVIWDV
ncbi:MAG TPA: hypothetical protein DIU00_22220 [Phycisphaerales bacterium]|nr:hypothetical protein [Phycisphaerales bacterium]